MDEPDAHEPPPLWGEAAFTRADGSSIAAQIRSSGEGVRLEAGAALEKGEALTGADGRSWIVAEVKTSADGGYSWATLAAAEQLEQPLNQIAPSPAPEAPPPARKAKKPDAASADEPGTDAADPDA